LASSVVIVLDTRAPEVVFGQPIRGAGEILVPYVVLGSEDLDELEAALEVVTTHEELPVEVLPTQIRASVPDGINALRLSVTVSGELLNSATYTLEFNVTHYSIGARIKVYSILQVAKSWIGKILGGKFRIGSGIE
jgi:hypothetical protein